MNCKHCKYWEQDTGICPKLSITEAKELKDIMTGLESIIIDSQANKVITKEYFLCNHYDLSEERANDIKSWAMQSQKVRRIFLVEFLHNNHKVFNKTYWEDDKERYEDIKKWQSESPMKRVRYVD